MKIYMSVTADRYELPVHVAETAVALARIYSMTANDIYTRISTGAVHREEKVKFIRVEAKEDIENQTG